MVLDAVVSGDLSAAREARGAFALYPGGSAANFAVGVARAGVRIRFIGKTGDDVAGRLLVGELLRHEVDARLVTSRAVPTGYVLVMHEASGATRMISDPGASGTLTPQELEEAWFEGIDAFHVTAYSVLREGPRAATLEALRLAKLRNPQALLTLDPAPAHLIGEARSWFWSFLEEHRFHILFPNYEEGVALTEKTDPLAIVSALAPLAPVVVLKLGEEGCLVASEGATVRYPIVPGPVVDTTGAGDAFAAGFVAEYATSRHIEASARAGAAAATAVIGRMGAR
jgi:sugar/nucleoside kinase (ribokinase family)